MPKRPLTVSFCFVTASAIALACGGSGTSTLGDAGTAGSGATSGGAGGSTAGTGGQGGSSGSGAVSGSGGSAGDCPNGCVGPGGPCTTTGECPQTCCDGTCDNGVCSGPTCPLAPPTDGQPCEAAMTCSYIDCPAVGTTTAWCDLGTGSWSVDVTPCAEFPCGNDGNLMCQPGEVCVQTVGGAGITVRCAPNPCGVSPIECTCAGAEICGDVTACTVNGTTVSCNPCFPDPCA